MNNFELTRLNCKINVTHLITLHSFKYTPDFLFTGEKHDFWEIAFIKSGEVGVMAESTGYTLKTGEAVFHKPNEYHNIWANGKSADVIIIAFKCIDSAMSFFKNKLFTLNHNEREMIETILSEGSNCFLEPLNIIYQTKLIKNPNSNFGCEQVIKNTLELLLTSITRNNAAISDEKRLSPLMKNKNEALIIDSIIRYLTLSINNNVTLDDVCSTICFSKTYLKKLFKSKTGFSIMDYYLKLKLNRAQILIDQGNLTLTEIAESLGFSSIHYFSRFFKQKTYMTPTQYLNRNR